jgi:hypothetical protein
MPPERLAGGHARLGYRSTDVWFHGKRWEKKGLRHNVQLARRSTIYIANLMAI